MYLQKNTLHLGGHFGYPCLGLIVVIFATLRKMAPDTAATPAAEARAIPRVEMLSLEVVVGVVLVTPAALT